MITALAIGFIAGLALIFYRGLYFGPWPAALNTMGTALIASVVFYIFLHILLSIGSFFLRILLVIIFASAVFIGGQKLWNAFNPDNPIKAPSSISNSMDRLTSKLW